MAPVGELTELFVSAHAGDAGAIERIFSLLYPELKVIARARLSRGQRLTMMDTTVLVHECFLRLQRQDQLQPADRQQFLAYAARVIRTVIVDIVRHEQAGKRGGVDGADTLDTAALDGLRDDRTDMLALAEALQALAAVDERLASVVEMRYFAGFSEAETAAALNVSERTVRRDWDKARAFLFIALQR